jgi:pilus assembly protein Flp/PilA
MTFWKDEEGLTVVEYAVAGGLIALVLIVAFQTLGTTVEDIICQINDELATGSGAGAACA